MFSTQGKQGFNKGHKESSYYHSNHFNHSNHNLIMKKIYLSMFTLLFVATVHAQVPQAFSYQAVIRNSSNALVANQSVSERISIVKDSAAGTVVYSETQSVKTNANGLVSLQIGKGIVLSGTFSDINWGAGFYFIRTETDPIGGSNYTISNTTQLLSVPYAFQAGNAPSTNLEYPDGFDNLTPILFDSTISSFTIPTGKNFYLTYSGGVIVIDANDTLKNSNSQIPILLGANHTIHSKFDNYNGISYGFMVDAKSEVVYERLNGSYTVPKGKSMYLLMICQNTKNYDYYINGMRTEQFENNPFTTNHYSIPIFPSGTVFSGNGFTINGYLK